MSNREKPAQGAFVEARARFSGNRWCLWKRVFDEVPVFQAFGGNVIPIWTH
jgi:hypothetical protein